MVVLQNKTDCDVNISFWKHVRCY